MISPGTFAGLAVAARFRRTWAVEDSSARPLTGDRSGAQTEAGLNWLQRIRGAFPGAIYSRCEFSPLNVKFVRVKLGANESGDAFLTCR